MENQLKSAFVVNASLLITVSSVQDQVDVTVICLFCLLLIDF